MDEQPEPAAEADEDAAAPAGSGGSDVAVQAARGDGEEGTATGGGPVWDHDPIRAAMPWDCEDVGLLGPELPGGRLHPLPESALPAGAAAEDGGAAQSRPARMPVRATTTIPWTDEAVLQDLRAAGEAPSDSTAREAASAAGGDETFSFQTAALEVGHMVYEVCILNKQRTFSVINILYCSTELC